MICTKRIQVNIIEYMTCFFNLLIKSFGSLACLPKATSVINLDCNFELLESILDKTEESVPIANE